MASLDELKALVESLGEKVKTLKAGGGDNKEAIGVAVKELLEAKKKYADENNGIGVDGKPYEAPMSKSEKKKLAKQQKQTEQPAQKEVSQTKKQLLYNFIPKNRKKRNEDTHKFKA